MVTNQAASSSVPGERPWARLPLALAPGRLVLPVRDHGLRGLGQLPRARRRAPAPGRPDLRRDPGRRGAPARLRYAASEINLHLFSVYSAVHVVVAAAAFALVWLVRLPPRRRLWMAAALGLGLVFAIVFVVWFTPTMVELGRAIDFMARDPAPPPVQRFFRLHGVNVTMEMIKLTLIAAVAVALLRR